MSITLRSPAKLNLYLKVLNKREDGFHNIKTIFERIDLCDEIRFEPNRNGKIAISCSDRDVPTGPKNLVHQVALKFQKDFGVQSGAEIKIEKNIPVAAGLAGGSSNAAAALRGLNRLWKLNLSRSQLLSYARKAGSDVAFFMHDASWAMGTGKGDRIEKIPSKLKLWHVLVVPRVKLYSGRVYGALKLKNKRPPALKYSSRKGQKTEKGGDTNLLTKTDDNATILIHYLNKNNINRATELLSNDLEKPVLRICPKLSVLQERLKSLNIQGVMVSGSGPAVFGIAKDRRQARSVGTELSKRYSRVFVVRTF